MYTYYILLEKNVYGMDQDKTPCIIKKKKVGS